MTMWPDRWSIGGLDPDTPVCRLGDARPVGRDRLLLLSDEEADVLSWLIVQGKVRREVQLAREQHRRWTDGTLTRVGAVVGLLLMLTSVILNLLALTHGGK